MEQRKKNMRNIRSKDTTIELRLRKALWHEGIRYRKNYKKIPGKPDIAITKYRIAVFCDSSFWHGRDFETKKKPATNTDYWEKKICNNIKRDGEVDSVLRAMGWTVLRFWDVEINKNLNGCIQTIKEAMFLSKIEDGLESDYDSNLYTGQNVHS